MSVDLVVSLLFEDHCVPCLAIPRKYSSSQRTLNVADSLVLSQPLDVALSSISQRVADLSSL